MGVVSWGPDRGPPTVTGGNLAELLDVDVDQLTGNSFFVAADGPPCGGVEVPGSGNSKPAKHPPHRGNHQSEMTSDPSRPPPPVDPQSDNPSFDTLGKPVRCRIWCRPPVDETALTVDQIPVPPFRRGLPGDTYLPGDMSNRTASGDPFTQDPPACWSKWGVSVHGEPPSGRVFVQDHTTREAQTFTTSTTLRNRTPSRGTRRQGTNRSNDERADPSDIPSQTANRRHYAWSRRSSSGQSVRRLSSVGGGRSWCLSYEGAVPGVRPVVSTIGLNGHGLRALLLL